MNCLLSRAVLVVRFRRLDHLCSYTCRCVRSYCCSAYLRSSGTPGTLWAFGFKRFVLSVSGLRARRHFIFLGTVPLSWLLSVDPFFIYFHQFSRGIYVWPFDSLQPWGYLEGPLLVIICHRRFIFRCCRVCCVSGLCRCWFLSG